MTELQYAPKPPLRRRRVARRVILFVCLVATALAAVRWYPQAREHALMLLWQRLSLNHRPPADEVVYGEGVEQASSLMSDGRYKHFAGPPQAAFLVPDYWSDFYAALSPPGFKSHGTVFLGRMTTRGGETRLVAVDMVIDSSSEILLTARVVMPGTLLKRPTLRSVSINRFPSAGLLSNQLTPGRVDPSDPTHLVLFDGRVEGWLREREISDSLELYQRDLTPPAPSSPASLPTSAAPATVPSAGRGGR